MKKIGIILLFVILSVAKNLTPGSFAFAQDDSKGRQIIDRQKATNTGYHDEIIRGEMTLLGPKGDKTSREFEVKHLEERGPVRAKSLIKILKPADLNGTALLSLQNPGGDDQWLYLPALKKTTRIIGQGKTGRFIGSEFTYEDLIPPKEDQYRYTWLREEPCDGGICHLIEATPLFSNSGYSKTVLFIKQDDLQNVRIDFYDKKGRLFKRGTFDERRNVGKFHRAFKISMQNLMDGRQTVLTIKNIRIGAALTDADFTKTALER